MNAQHTSNTNFAAKSQHLETRVFALKTHKNMILKFKLHYHLTHKNIILINILLKFKLHYHLTHTNIILINMILKLKLHYHLTHKNIILINILLKFKLHYHLTHTNIILINMILKFKLHYHLTHTWMAWRSTHCWTKGIYFPALSWNLFYLASPLTPKSHWLPPFRMPPAHWTTSALFPRSLDSSPAGRPLVLPNWQVNLSAPLLQKPSTTYSLLQT